MDSQASVSAGELAVILPFAAALATAVIPAVVSYAKDLSDSSQRTRLLSEAKVRVEFWKAWKEAAGSLTDRNSADGELFESEVRRAAYFVRDIYPPSSFDMDTVKGYSDWLHSLSSIRRMFLLYDLRSFTALANRTYFWMFLITIPLCGKLARWWKTEIPKAYPMGVSDPLVVWCLVLVIAMSAALAHRMTRNQEMEYVTRLERARDEELAESADEKIATSNGADET